MEDLPSKIIGIQFSVLSSEEIKKSSVVEVKSKETYSNNKPAIDGLFDPRMGVLEYGLLCPTDFYDYKDCPGYHGHIDLELAVHHIQYLQDTLKICKCICIKCGKLLINKEKYKQAYNLEKNKRWDFVYEVIDKLNIKRCGSETTDGCGSLQPSKVKKEGLADIYFEFTKSEQISEENKKKSKKVMVNRVTPEDFLVMFKRISDEDIDFMGFSSIWSRPESFICQTLIVPPPAIRPSVKQDAQQRSEDDLTHILMQIIKQNTKIKNLIKQNNMAIEKIEYWRNILQLFVATMVDNNISGVDSLAQRSGRPYKSIKDRLNGKTGRMRANVQAKRVDFSARSVITADPNISVKQLGVPIRIAKNITKPVVVNEKNYNFLKMLLINGPDVYPGAKTVVRGVNTFSLKYMNRQNFDLKIGDIVNRHMMDDDYVLFNRQPTLHRMSMMGHQAKILLKGDTFRMNLAVTKSYNADFDKQRPCFNV
jgi:DNA-directed RNA polymerase II subunit RPB1